MRRLFIWISIGVTAAGLVACAALVLALRVVPEKVVPRLPLIATVWLSSVASDEGRKLIRERLREPDSAPVVVAGLSGSTGEQRRMIEALSRASLLGNSWQTTSDVERLLRRLCMHEDPYIRSAARSNFSTVDQALRWTREKRGIERIVAVTHPPGPGTWLPSRSGALGLVTLGYLGAGYDHRMPSKYKATVSSLMARLVAGQDVRGRFADEDRDHAIVTMAVAEAYAMSMDPALKNPARHGVQWLLRDDGQSAEQRWSLTTDLAVWDLMAMKSAGAGGLPSPMERTQRWMQTSTDLGTVIRERGQVIAATPADILARRALMLAFTADSALTKIPAVDLIPNAGQSAVTSYWLSLALFQQGSGDFYADMAPFLRDVLDHQDWDEQSERFGCLDANGDVVIHALRTMTVEIFYRYMPVPTPGAKP